MRPMQVIDYGQYDHMHCGCQFGTRQVVQTTGSGTSVPWVSQPVSTLYRMRDPYRKPKHRKPGPAD